MRSLVRTALAVAVIVTAFGCSSDSNSSGATVNTNTRDTFCSLLLSFRVTNDALADDLSSGDKAQAQEAMSRLVNQSEVLLARAPADIEADVAVVATFVTSLDTLMADNGYDIARIEADPAAAEAFLAINNDAVAESLGQLRAYGDSDCADEPAASQSP